ncbi:hypothetical protein BaRGS_00017510 [Batillaria attramentaria]|uniref:Thioredoxin domain-containing protein n=1 Tax=Batillaria attramentaria TaxID=370345 RepID=A0ABD0KVT4_9CAEN
MDFQGPCSLALMLSACLFSFVRADHDALQHPSTTGAGLKQTDQVVEDLKAEQNTLHKAQDPGTGDINAKQETSQDARSEEDGDIDPTTKVKTEIPGGSTDSADAKPAVKKQKITLQAIGAFGGGEEDEYTDTENKPQQSKDESWTEQTDSGTEQKRGGGRRFFSLMNLIKFLLNPVIEEFQEVEKSSNSSDVANKSSANSSEATEKDESKNTTDSSKKTKFHCVGKNVTENTTALVRVVNSTVLLELLSFDKNQSVSDCVLVMFYAPWCHFCAATAPHYNALGRAFPQLDVLAVDTVHFSNLNARFGTVAVPNIMLFHQSRSAVRFNHTERHFDTLVQFIKNTTGLEPNATVTITEEDFHGPLSSTPTEETDYLLWLAWIFLVVCGGHLFVQSRPGQCAIERVKVLWQEHQHIE